MFVLVKDFRAIMDLSKKRDEPRFRAGGRKTPDLGGAVVWEEG